MKTVLEPRRTWYAAAPRQIVFTVLGDNIEFLQEELVERSCTELRESSAPSVSDLVQHLSRPAKPPQDHAPDVLTLDCLDDFPLVYRRCISEPRMQLVETRRTATLGKVIERLVRHHDGIVPGDPDIDAIRSVRRYPARSSRSAHRLQAVVSGPRYRARWEWTSCGCRARNRQFEKHSRPVEATGQLHTLKTPIAATAVPQCHDRHAGCWSMPVHPTGGSEWPSSQDACFAARARQPRRRARMPGTAGPRRSCLA